jgi:REP element-mobilizing transposase RayT
MDFRFFDPGAKTEISQGSLPHWEQADAYYFITWRTADSIPADVFEKWHEERCAWLRDHGIDPSLEDWQREVEMMPERDHREFYRLFTAKWHGMLDECHGECALRQPELSGIVEENLRHMDGEKYQLEAFVVMPNHVHVLAGIRGRGEMQSLCRNWKRYTAGRINALLGKSGQFWQWESFDHVVRNAASLEKFRQYILNNPVKARLKKGEFRAWAKPK